MLQELHRFPAALMAGIATLVICAFRVPADAKQKYKIFDPPGSINTRAHGINSAASIAGDFVDGSHNLWHGYVRFANGQFELFDPRGSVETKAPSINDGGWVAGYFWDDSGAIHGFVRSPEGDHEITAFDFPGAKNTVVPWTGCINAQNFVAGYYQTQKPNKTYHGFIRSPDGTLTSFDPPDSVATKAYAINDAGSAAGFFKDGGGNWHGFVRKPDPDGTFQTIDFPDARQTQVLAINNKGTVAGYYEDQARVLHAFIRDKEGTFTSVDPAGSTYDFAIGLGKDGSIVGQYWDPVHHGFLRDPGGTITVIEPKGSTDSGAWSINVKGTISGQYADQGGRWHGYCLGRQCQPRWIAMHGAPSSAH